MVWEGRSNVELLRGPEGQKGTGVKAVFEGIRKTLQEWLHFSWAGKSCQVVKRNPLNLLNPVFSTLLWPCPHPSWWGSCCQVVDPVFLFGTLLWDFVRVTTSAPAFSCPLPWSPTSNSYRITGPDEEIWGAPAPGVLAGDGELQGKPLEKILCLCRRDPGTVPELSGEAGEREGGVPQPSPSSLGPRALRAQKWRQNWAGWGWRIGSEGRRIGRWRNVFFIEGVQ